MIVICQWEYTGINFKFVHNRLKFFQPVVLAILFRAPAGDLLRRMLVVASVGMAFTVSAQTNLPNLDLFVIPGPQLRAEPVKAPAPASPLKDIDLLSVPKPAPSPTFTDLRSDGFTLSAEGSEDFRRYYAIHGNSGLVLPTPKPGVITRAFDSVFRPEEFRIGRTATLSCSVLTAIKRKDPLCLLNPIFFNISW